MEKKLHLIFHHFSKLHVLPHILTQPSNIFTHFCDIDQLWSWSCNDLNMCMSLDIDVCAFEMAISWCRKGKKSLLPFRLSPRHFVCLVFWNCLVIVLSQWKNFHFRYLNLNLDARSIYFSFTCFILLCLLWGRLFIVFGLPDRTQLGLNFGFTKEVTTEFKLDQVNCAKV